MGRQHFQKNKPTIFVLQKGRQRSIREAWHLTRNNLDATADRDLKSETTVVIDTDVLVN